MDEGVGAYTIDELSARTGVPTRTIRFYQSKGALDAPERDGRVALYSDGHVDRLRLIAELQDRGLRLDAIRDLLHQMRQGGDSLQEWLGLGEKLQAPWSDDTPAVLTHEELVDRIGDARPGLLADLVDTGLVERQGRGLPRAYVVPSPGLLDVALQLDAAGVDVRTASGAEAILRRRLGRAADELVAWFSDRAGQGFGARADAGGLGTALDALRPLGAEAVRLIFAQEMERAVGALVERGTPPQPKSRRRRNAPKPPR